MRGSQAVLRKLLPTRSAAMRSLVETVEKIAAHDVNVLLVGETGSGKDHLADVIHRCGPRSECQLVRIDCPAVPPDLFESELFGHEKGAFTGAYGRKIGRIELAGGGTLYIDEVTALPSPLQAKLLRVLQERSISRIGGSRPIEVDIRVIASTSVPPARLADGSELRKDLFYRLNVVTVEIPPLRARRADIPQLARLFLREAAREAGRRISGFSEDALDLLRSHSWPGNLRELRNVVQRAVLLETGPSISLASLPFDLISAPELVSAAAEERWSLEELELRYIREVMRRTRGNYTRAAELLGINRKTLLEKRKRYGLG
ncbi:MAG TPA: sigma-54 dependent transcriptional regulator [Thermoanaerobaculia bacterium]|nr:sigma-54 dependent transcriptional regulator [Thermoanaerobaculia bacterium]